MNALQKIDVFEQQLGAFARIFPRSSAHEVADAFVANSLFQVQLNLNAIGLPTIPHGFELERTDLGAIRTAFEERGRSVWGLSATYNAAHPDNMVRRTSTARAAQFIRTMSNSGAVAATLCTGSRDPENMWRKHPDNASESAWRDMRESLEALLSAAEESNVQLAVEPEPGNVVAGTAQAIRLIRELGDDARHIGFILDPANLISEHEQSKHEAVLREAFDQLGTKTICVHAKDTVPWTETLDGLGVVDYELVLDLRSHLPRHVPLIIQDATEVQIPELCHRLRSIAATVA
ncbi:TIM barrel protein [Arthrobacter sp. BE255]|uniref:sugar phosphate isomerase/epimerase family protein n=1 Tax=Arthrobacter sp. BE255 TaxID=2817721 RepID=UPI0028589304|nr:TIM barrel protein [Arthrobacter sp. BE255]MDR7158372.1 sugar phosphate isomerase/epimerase [Arthrobacter sp. BE255]